MLYEVITETAKYFANILMPFAGPVGKVVEKLTEVLKNTKIIGEMRETVREKLESMEIV